MALFDPAAGLQSKRVIVSVKKAQNNTVRRRIFSLTPHMKATTKLAMT